MKSSCILLAHLFAALSFVQGFVRYTLVKEGVTAFDADARCKTRGFDGLAIIDTAPKWNYTLAVLQYENVTLSQKMWIGLERDVQQDIFFWRNDQALGWAAWGSGIPARTNTHVAVLSSGGVWGWDTDGGNYNNWLLCSSETRKLKMSQHPNQNMVLTSVAPLLTQPSSSHEECGVACSTMSACRYVASQPSPTPTLAAGGTCQLYDSRADAQLGTVGNLNNFTFFTVILS